MGLSLGFVVLAWESLRVTIDFGVVSGDEVEEYLCLISIYHYATAQEK